MWLQSKPPVLVPSTVSPPRRSRYFFILNYRRFNIKRYNKERTWNVSRLISPLVQTLHKKGRNKSALRYTKAAPSQAGIRLIFRFSFRSLPIPQPKTPTGKVSERKRITVLSAQALARNSCPLGSLTLRSKMKNRKKNRNRKKKKTNLKFRFVVVTNIFLIERNEES